MNIINKIKNYFNNTPLDSPSGSPSKSNTSTSQEYSPEIKVLLDVIQQVGDNKVIGIVSKSSSCLESYPCKHNGPLILEFSNGEELKLERLSSTKIGVICMYYALLLKNNKEFLKTYNKGFDYNHFIDYGRNYIDDIRKLMN